MDLKENDIIDVVGVDYTFDGLGVAKYEDKTIFVTNLIIGEKAQIKITSVRRTFYIAKIIKLLTISPDRVVPVSKTATASGISCFEHLSYQKELEFKTEKVKRAFRTIAKMTPKINETIGMENPYFYRNKVAMPLGLDRNSRLIHGYYRYRSHDIVPMSDNSLEDKRAIEVIETVKKYMTKYNYKPYDEKTRQGIIKKIVIRTSHYFEQVMLILVTSVQNIDGFDNFVKEIIKDNTLITTVVQNINSQETNVILGKQNIIKYANGCIEDKLLGLTFKISPLSFYQINTVQTEVIYKIALSLANLSKDDVILDAYSGIGTIGLIASKDVKEVYGVEVVKDAVEDAKYNALVNNISNVTYVCDDATSFINSSVKTNKYFDVVFVDPPRKGLDTKFVEALLILKPKKIIYISCDPGTLARDIKDLSELYNIETVQPIDMFSRTFHVENVVLLSLK